MYFFLLQSPLLFFLEVSIQHADFPLCVQKEFLQSPLDPGPFLANYHVPDTGVMGPQGDHFVDNVQQ